jgi:hypothetical protein
MVMAEDKIIHLVPAGIVFSKFIKWLRLTFEHIFILAGKPVSL